MKYWKDNTRSGTERNGGLMIDPEHDGPARTNL